MVIGHCVISAEFVSQLKFYFFMVSCKLPSFSYRCLEYSLNEFQRIRIDFFCVDAFWRFDTEA